MVGSEQKLVELQQNEQGDKAGKTDVSDASRPVGYPDALGFVLRTQEHRRV